MNKAIDIQKILHTVSLNGFAIVESFETDEDKILQKHFEIVNKIGIPSEHNKGKKDFIWRISPKKSESTIPTFSEHNKKAELHTDSQYRLEPERYFSLSSIIEASCGGGHSILLDLKKILAELKNEHEEFFNELKRPYPIIIPDIFDLDKKGFIEVPIIESENKIRYRYDTIIKGMKKKAYNENDKKWKAFDYLTQKIKTSNHATFFTLKKGQILIIDNHRMLHGRTGFLDIQRLLYRIRFN